MKLYAGIFSFRLITALLVCVFIVSLTFMAPITSGASTNDTVTVDVSIQGVGQIVVTPTSVSWSNLEPGSIGSIINLTIENAGSNNLSEIYVSVNTWDIETSNPLGTGNPAVYAASGFMLIQNESSSNDKYYYAGRLEWNLSDILSNEILSLGSGTENFSHGWYRNLTNKYLWKLENGSAGYCNNTGTSFVLKKSPENSTTENRDITTDSESCTFDSAGVNWSTHTCSDADNPLTGHCIAAYKDCDRVYLYRYDYSSEFPTCSDREYLTNVTLTPSDTTKARVFASIPSGTPQGSTAQAVLTIYATF
jgi:hypothetical protein